MSRWRISRIRLSPATVLWITMIWVLLWEDISPANIMVGALLGVVIPSFFPLPTFGYHGHIRQRHLIHLIYRFLVDLVAASFQVAFLALDFRHVPRTAIVGVELRSQSDLYMFITSEITTLVPGSVVVEALRRNGVIYVHVLDLEGVGGAEAVRRNVLAIEERVLKAFASDEELASVGLRVGGNP